MKNFRLIVVTVWLAALTVGVTHAAPEEVATAGRDVMKRYADAVVGIELVLTLRVKSGDREAPPREQRIEVMGTVISPDGLTVTTLAAVDPQATMEAMGGSSDGRGPQIVGSEFKEVKLRLADGKEVPARFVLKDADLDLAFMAPETSEAGKTYPNVRLEDAVEGAILNTYFYVARAPKTLQRVPMVRRTEIMGMVDRPRRLYVLNDLSPGTPVFDPSGKVLGITVQHFANGKRTGLVVLPAADVADMSKQAAAAQAKSAASAQP